MAMGDFNHTEIISIAIRQGIQRAAEEEFERLKEELVKKFESQKNQIVAGIVLDVESHIRYDLRERELVITIRKVDNSES